MSLSQRQEEIQNALPATADTLSDQFGISVSTVYDHISALKQAGTRIELKDGQYLPVDDPDKDELTQREQYIYESLPCSKTDLADDLGVSEAVVQAHFNTIQSKGWDLQHDNQGNYIGPDLSQLRSTQAKQTRTRIANEWWQSRHDWLTHDFKSLSTPNAELAHTTGHEDWITHMTDLHAGDIVRDDVGTPIHETSDIPGLIDYISSQSLGLARKHNSTYDTAHLLWGGDFVTNEGVYEGQHEDLDAWLDEQVDILHDPLLAQIKAFANEFQSVQIVCKVGNHGDIRASGTTRQANADLLVYKSLRNTVAALQDEGLLDNVRFLIGEARAYRNFTMRGDRIKGHLRHGQDRQPQAKTSARLKEWMSTLLNHEFDIAYMGHHHVSGRIPWDGPPVLATGTVKPSGDYAEKLGVTVPRTHREIAHAHGVSDDGITCVFPIDTRNYAQ